MEYMEMMLLNVGLSVHEADWNFKNVTSPFARIFLIVSGEAVLHVPDGAYRLSPGMVCFIPPFQTHSYECDGHFSLYYMHIYQRALADNLSQVYQRPVGGSAQTVFDRYDFPVVMRGEWGMLRDILSELCDRYPDFKLYDSDPQAYDTRMSFLSLVNRFESMPASDIMYMQGVMLYALSMVIARSSARPWTYDPEMIRISEYLTSHLSDKLQINELSRRFSLSPDHFTRKFKSCFGVAPIVYINRKRIELACNLLLNSHYSIKEIGYSVGFEDATYFIRMFKKIIGVTPRQYRHAAMC